MQFKAFSVVLTAVLMTNFSATAHGLDESPSSVKGIYRAESGGVATGGGNRLRSYEIGNGGIEFMLQKSKVPVKYALRSVEMMIFLNDAGSDGDPTTKNILMKLGKKIFSGPVTIYDALEKSVLVAKKDGACLDVDGKEVDASAKDAPTLCFSVQRLANLKDNTAGPEVIALVAHEVSHMVGTNEDEATMIQNMVNSNLQKYAIEKIPLDRDAYVENIKNIISSARDLKFLADQRQYQMVCSMASGLQAAVTNLLRETVSSSNVGAVFLRPTEFKAIYGVLLKSMNVMSSCLPENSAYSGIKNAFGNRSEMSMEEFTKAIYKEMSATFPPPNWKIRRIRNDNGSLNMELADILQALEKINQEI